MRTILAKLIIEEIAQASAPLGLAVLRLPVRGPSDFPGALQAATRAHAEALAVLDDTAITQHRTPILGLAAQHALPVGSIYKDFAEAGGLIAYGPNLPALYRRAVYYVERILQGAKPSELPVERPTCSSWSSTSRPPTHSASRSPRQSSSRRMRSSNRRAGQTGAGAHDARAWPNARSGADALQLTLRFSFQARLTASVRHQKFVAMVL